ncbi:MAG: GNAT family N-acetyltransferase [Rhodospirillales bacterium]|nr:GNAT family N-acetyltransferase [Rhodospirillales bacterium]
MTLTSPQPIQADHDLLLFDSGRPVLDDWLKQRAIRNEHSGASRTYVICDDGRVIGYYCLSSGAVEAGHTPGKVRRNMPDPIPIMLMGRLAIDKTRQGENLGSALLRDAILRTLKAADIVGMRALLVHALDDRAASFYLQRGFLVSPIDPLILMLPLDTARKAIN